MSSFPGYPHPSTGARADPAPAAKSRMWWGRLVRRARFGERTIHELVVPPGPDGRPGERVLAKSPSLYEPRITPDDCREDFKALVGRRSTLAAVCLGRVSDRGGPEYSAMYSIHRITGASWLEPPQTPKDEAARLRFRYHTLEMAGEEAVSYRVELNSSVLNEWKFAHAGWLFVAGVHVRQGDDEREMVQRTQAILSTWQWIEAPDGAESLD